MGIFSKINPKDLTVALFDGSLRLLEQPNFNLTRLKTNLAGKTLGGVESGLMVPAHTQCYSLYLSCRGTF